MAPITAGWAENVPTTYATRMGCSGSNRRMRVLVLHTTPIGIPPATVLPYTTMSARTPKYSCAPPGASRKPV